MSTREATLARKLSVVTCGHPDVATGFPDDQNMLYQGEDLTREISATTI
jgi:hypothetical protein